MKEFKELIHEMFERFGAHETAVILDTSITNVKRWESGQVVPPAARIIRQFAEEALEGKEKE